MDEPTTLRSLMDLGWAPPRTTLTTSHLAEIDEEIREIVRILDRGGVETFESCQGGPGHCFELPTVRFHGDVAAGWKALGVALDHGLPVTKLQRYWSIDRGEPTDPKWEMVFRPDVPYEPGRGWIWPANWRSAIEQWGPGK